MRLCKLSLLLVVLWAAPGWSAADRGQSGASTTDYTLLPIDEATFELAVATEGFYYFWQPGEFARVAAGESGVLFVPGGRTVEQIDGRVQGSLDLPFEVDADFAEIIVRVGLQSLGEIELWAPGGAAPYEGELAERTAHMLIVRARDPRPGTWTVRLVGSGVYLVNVTGRGGESAPELAEPDAGCDWTGGGSREPTYEDLACFRSASPEERWDFFRRLPASRRERIARSLLDDEDPLVAYIAAGSLARDGYVDEAVPVFARILVRGESETALEGRMGYDWIHDDDATLADRILHALGQHLRAHLNDYSPKERARAERFLRE
jgi:hypothetical protein